MSQCIAHKKSGQQCRRKAVTGYSVCSAHGAGKPMRGRRCGLPKRKTNEECLAEINQLLSDFEDVLNHQKELIRAREPAESYEQVLAKVQATYPVVVKICLAFAKVTEDIMRLHKQELAESQKKN